MKTENKALDSFWNLGLKPSGLIVIAARPGMGITSFLLLVGKRISQQYKTQLISLEYSVIQLRQKNISVSILIDDSPVINIERLSEIISQNKPEVVLIEYIQLMTGDRENLIKDLKNMAVKFNVCIIVTSQISREPKYRALSDRRPIISNLTVDGTMFNSNNITYIDNLTFFYRVQYYNYNSQKTDTIELIQYDNGDKQTHCLR